MPLIKLIKYFGPRGYCYECGSYDGFNNDLSEWQEVSDDDLEFLTSSEGQRILQKNTTTVVVLEDITSKETVQGFVSDIKKFVENEKKKEEARIAAFDRREKTRKENAEKKKIEKAQKLLKDKGLLK